MISKTSWKIRFVSFNTYFGSLERDIIYLDGWGQGMEKRGYFRLAGGAKLFYKEV